MNREKPLGGRGNSHKPTDKMRGQVEGMAGAGCPHTDISLVLGISVPTLLKYYRQELDVGLAKAHSKARQTLFQAGVNEKNPTLLMFYCRTQLGMTEKNALDLTIHADPDNLSDAELAAIARRGSRQAAAKASDEEESGGLLH